MSSRKARQVRRNRSSLDKFATERLWLEECPHCGVPAVGGLYRDMESTADRLSLNWPTGCLPVIVEEGWPVSEVVMIACTSCHRFTMVHGADGVHV